MAHTLVDKIVKDILKNQTSGPSQTVINRPNYQRNRGSSRVQEITNTAIPSGIVSNPVNHVKEAYNAPVKQSSIPDMPSGTLFKIALKPNPAPVTVQQAEEFKMPPVTKHDEKRVSRENNSTFKTPTGSFSGKVFGQTQFVGTAAGNTLGYVIPNLDYELREKLLKGQSFRAVGVISSRRGAAAQIMAADEAVKKTNSVIVDIQLARDDFGGTGHGALIILGAEDVADVKRAVEITLSYVDVFQENVVETADGKIETLFSARSAAALNQAFAAPLNQAFGIIIGAPAGLGLLMSDTAIKSAPVNAVKISGPSVEQAFANEFWLMISGDPASVRNALDAAKEIGQKILSEFKA